MTSIQDKSWVKQSFILPRNAIDNVDRQRRIFNQGYRKFSDTTLGGNASINPPYQFTRYADLKEKRFHRVSRGMGRWYSENIDDNAVHLHMRFGVPSYNSLTQFFGNFYSSDASAIARTGRSDGLLYSIGRLGGFIATIPFTGWIILGQTIKFLSGTPSTRYCYLKPTMHVYWKAVNTLVNNYAVNAGLTTGANKADAGDIPSSLDATEVAQRQRLLPDIYQTDGSIDVFKLSTRFQRLANYQFAQLKEMRDNAADENSYFTRLLSWMDEPILLPREPLLNDYIDKFLTLKQYSPVGTTDAEVPVTDETSPDGQTKVVVNSTPTESSADYFGTQGSPDIGLQEALTAELQDGAQFVTFAVQGAETVSESFSSSVRESDIASAINGASSSSRNMKFNFANGNLDDSIIGKTIGAVVGGVGSLVSGFLDQISMSGLASLAGNAFVDIPKHWDESTTELPKMSYTLELRTPYGNDISIFNDLIVPLMMLLAGAVPRSTGSGSYTFPFHCEAYCQGRAQTRYGIIDSLSITRGTGNIGWTRDGKPLGIDVSVSIIDLSSIAHMPLTESFSPFDILDPGALGKLLTNDDSSFTDYIATLSSLSLTDQIYSLRKLKRNWNKNVLEFERWRSPANTASWVAGLPPARLLSALYNGTDRG